MRKEDHIAGAMAAARKAVVEAPSHEELFAALEAVLRYDPDAPKPETDAELGIKAAIARGQARSSANEVHEKTL